MRLIRDAYRLATLYVAQNIVGFLYKDGLAVVVQNVSFANCTALKPDGAALASLCYNLYQYPLRQAGSYRSL